MNKFAEDVQARAIEKLAAYGINPRIGVSPQLMAKLEKVKDMLIRPAKQDIGELGNMADRLMRFGKSPHYAAMANADVPYSTNRLAFQDLENAMVDAVKAQKAKLNMPEVSRMAQ